MAGFFACFYAILAAWQAAEFARWAVHARSFPSRPPFAMIKNAKDSGRKFWSEPCFRSARIDNGIIRGGDRSIQNCVRRWRLPQAAGS
jgi:hypothetical protein